MKINFVGTILGITGYDSHCRNLFNALYELNPDIKLEIPLPPDWMRQVNDAELNAITKEPRKADVTIAVTQPQFWRLYMDNCDKFVGFLIFEGSCIPKYWIDYLLDDRVSQIWVPSKHTKNAITNTVESLIPGKCESNHDIIYDKVKIVPHGVSTTIFKPQEVKKDKFVFLSNKGWRGTSWDRGGVQYVIKAFCEEFKKDEPVELLLKLNPSYVKPQMIGQHLKELNLPKDRPQIRVNCDNVPYNKLTRFYHESDVVVSPTRAEAFNLPLAEGMACGIPVITTNYGGQIDFVNEKNGWLIDYKLEEVKEDLQYEGVKWGIPDINHLRELMRESFANREKTKEKGQQALKDIQLFTWKHSAKKALDFLKII